MFIREQFCFRCDKDTTHYNGSCGDCEAREREAAHKRHFDELDKLTLEQRLRKVEEWIYEHKCSSYPVMDI